MNNHHQNGNERETDTEKSLRAWELSHRQLFETSQDGILILDAEAGRVKDVNPFLVNLLGFSRSEMVGKTVRDLSAFRDIAGNTAMLERLQKEKHVRYENLPMETRDGRQIAVEFVSNAYRNGELKVIQCSIRDITDRKRMENSSHASEERYRTLYNSIDEGFCVIEMLFDENGAPNDYRFLETNPAFERQTGMGGAVGKRMRELVPDHEQFWFDTYGKVALTGEAIRMEKKADAMNRWFDVYAFRLGDLAHRNVAILFTDITQRKTEEKKTIDLNLWLEQRVAERTAQLKTANEELEAFSYSVSHDLRAPLRHVMGFVNLLQKDATSSMSEKSRKHLTTISDSARRMGDLIDDLLDFSRVGRAVLNKTSFPLDQLVQETQGDFKEETKARRINWEISPLPTVFADRALLRLVLVNLVSNALKFTSRCAEARIQIGTVSGKIDEQIIFIRDNGAGFDSSYAHKLFGVFQRLHSNAEFEGTGIGLANVQRIVHRHGGRVWAEGSVGAGATFYFSIPQPINGDINGH